MNNTQIQPRTAGLFKRFAAMVYDLFLVFAVLAFATIPIVTINDGKTISSNIYYQLYLVCIWFLFYGWFWTHGGQTLGMKAWNLYALNENGNIMNWKQVLIRFITACFGLSNMSILFNRNKLAWHERLSSTTTVIIK